MRSILAALVAAGCSLPVSAPPASAQDWTGWRGANRDGKLEGFKPPAEWPKELAPGWKAEVGEGTGTPALAGGKLYVHARQGAEEVALCLDAATGKQVWREALVVEYEPENAARFYGKGPFSSPAVADGRVYTFGITGVLSCHDAASGRLLWRNDFKDDYEKPWPLWGTGLSPLLTDGLCIVHVGREKKGAIIALEAAAEMKVRWRTEGDGPSYASPVVATVGGKKQVVAQTEAGVVGLDLADGKQLWQFEFKTGYEQNSVTPVIHGDLLIVSGYNKGTTAYRLGGAAPAQVWTTNDVSMYMSTAVLNGDRLFGYSERAFGQFFCLNPKDGTVSWKGKGRLGKTEISNGSVLNGGSVILVLVTQDPTKAKEPSFFTVFDASDKGYVERASYKVADGPALAHPVVSGKSIIVKDKTKLIQWTLP